LRQGFISVVVGHNPFRVVSDVAYVFPG